jgi:hypothetical protein
MSVAEFTKPIKVVKKKIKKIIEEETQDEPIDTNISAKDKSRYMVASQLSQLGISHEQGRHHDVIVLADSYKKKVYSQVVKIGKTIKCGFCRQTIPSTQIPIGCPIKADIITKKLLLEGSYCSLNCMLSFLNNQESIKYRECGIYIYMLLQFFIRVTNQMIKIDDIELCKDYRELVEFGGSLSVDEWKPKSFYILGIEHLSEFLERCDYLIRLFIGE